MFFQYFVFPSPFLYHDPSFGMQKPSHVTNIHRKFQDFFLCSLGAIKVLHFTVRSEDGVNTFTLFFLFRGMFHRLEQKQLQGDFFQVGESIKASNFNYDILR